MLCIFAAAVLLEAARHRMGSGTGTNLFVLPPQTLKESVSQTFLCRFGHRQLHATGTHAAALFNQCQHQGPPTRLQLQRQPIWQKTLWGQGCFPYHPEQQKLWMQPLALELVVTT